MAAADGFTIAAMHAQEQAENGVSNRSVLCEHHEDYAVLDEDEVELVSVKHRELSSGSWTWATLADDGGLAHLFARWGVLGKTVQCRMVTNAELGTGEPSQLREACQKLRLGSSPLDCVQEVRAFAIELIRHADKANLPNEWRVPEKTPKAKIYPSDELLEEVAAFLAILQFDTRRPQRDDIAAAAPVKYAEPLLEELGLSTNGDASKAAWAAVLGMFRQRMRGRGKVPLGELAALIGRFKRETPADGLARKLRRRHVTASDVIAAVNTAVLAPQAYVSVDLTLAATRLAAKLHHGGCSPTTILTAESLAARWRRAMHERMPDVPGSSVAFADAEMHLRVAASAAAEAAASASGDSLYGSAMWQRLSSRDLTPALKDLPLSGDSLLALGGICDLASRCQVWFGPEFDVELAQTLLRASRPKARAGVEEGVG
ncbi:hypothetical protein [Dactylosporangium sp. NPDC000521]|uniref:hypothetical protein n=1 Tax=Dactylosporangium sp. NPDC000521 TaxID=3363975 RepID=UPI00368FF55C